MLVIFLKAWTCFTSALETGRAVILNIFILERFGRTPETEWIKEGSMIEVEKNAQRTS